MNIKITKPIQGGTVKAISSKSEAHRLLICAAFADKETFVACPESSEDINATVCCLTGLGAVINASNDGYRVTPVNRTALNKEKYSLDCGESGATLRFMLPVCGALGISAEFQMSGRLPSRPLTELKNAMESHGCMIEKPTHSLNGQSLLTCSGQLKSGDYTLPGNISSQYISGLLLALPLLGESSTIKVTGRVESRPYVDMTIEALQLFGIKIIENEPDTFVIQAGQSYNSPKKVKTGGDWSNAAFWLSAGAIGKNSITCTDIDINSKQGDKAICEILERLGAKVSYDKNTVTVSPGSLKGIEINAENTPDLVPVLAAVAAVAQGKTVIYNAQRLRIKESDRLKTVTEMLTKLGADIKETNDGLIINGKEKLITGTIESHRDHRIAMTAAVISSVCTEPVEIIGADTVNKSYPRFFEDFKALGGEWIL